MHAIFVQGVRYGHLAHAKGQKPSRMGRQYLFILVAALGISSMYPSRQVCADNLKRPVRIGVLTESWGPTPATIGLRDGLETSGYREDRDYFLGVRFGLDHVVGHFDNVG